MAKVLGPLAFLFFVLVMAGFAGTSDFEQARREDRIYCERVASGDWPDFKGNAESVCPPAMA